jgi:serine protease Do
LAVSLLLTGGLVVAQQTSTPAPEAQLLDEEPGAFSFFIGGGSFLGVYVEDVNKDNLSQYGLREAHGVGITEVAKDSPAEKAGLKKGDVILRFDNEAVTSTRKLTRLVSEEAPDHAVNLTISRGGAEQQVSVTIGTRSDGEKLRRMTLPDGNWGNLGNLRIEGPNDGLVYALGNGRRIGVSTMSLSKQLGDYFGVTDGKGVLIESVSEDSPAAKAGLKAGDVITAVDGQPVENAGDLSRAINKRKDGDVTLAVVRDKRQQTIKATPKERTGSTLMQPGTPQAMRRIVIPRIDLPSIPAIDVVTPRIDLPVIPEINVVVPKVRVVRSGRVLI